MHNRRSAKTKPMRVFGAILAFVLMAVSPFTANPAFAGALDDAKRAGYVGERLDGYVGLVDKGAPAAVQQLVDSINAKRRARYAAIAKRTGSGVRDVGILAGEKLVANAPAGTYVMGTDGRWQRK